MRPRLAPSSSARARAMSCAVLATALVAIAACSNPEGVTPTCTNNVDKNGVHPDPNGCQQFAMCNKGAPADCCEGRSGDELAMCLYGFGGCAALVTMIDDKGKASLVCAATYDAGGAGGGGGGAGGGESDGGGHDAGSDGG